MGVEGGRGVPPRPDYSKSPKAKAREARRDPLVYIYIYIIKIFRRRHRVKNRKGEGEGGGGRIILSPAKVGLF